MTLPRREPSEKAIRSFMHAAVSILALSFLALPGFLGQLSGFPLLILMFVAMYFLLVAPNQRKQKTWQAMLAQLKAGDKVTTNAGIRGTIVSVKDDVLVIKTAPDGVKLEFVKSAIAAVTTDDVK
jgi:preprotein translocase subunit YajC